MSEKLEYIREDKEMIITESEHEEERDYIEWRVKKASINMLDIDFHLNYNCNDCGEEIILLQDFINWIYVKQNFAIPKECPNCAKNKGFALNLRKSSVSGDHPHIEIYEYENHIIKIHISADSRLKNTIEDE